MQPANSAANTHPSDPTAVLGLFACLRTSAGSTSVDPVAVSG